MLTLKSNRHEVSTRSQRMQLPHERDGCSLEPVGLYCRPSGVRIPLRCGDDSRLDRVLPIDRWSRDGKGLDKVRFLQHDAYLYAWERGYDGAGCWNDDLAKAALRKIRDVRKAARGKRPRTG